MTLLLIKNDPTVFQYIQAVIYFMNMIQYKFHINKTL